MRILIIDDNEDITENISLYLKGKWYDTDTARDWEIAFEMINRKKYDFLIIDRMMPNIDGLSLVRMLEARSIQIPFLFLTALGKQTDKIEWLSLWADDYLVKPFDLQELALRIDNIMRRNGITEKPSNQKWIELGDIVLECEARRVTRQGKPVELSPKEYDLFEILAKNRGKVLDRDFLYEKIWWDYDASEKVLETINVHVAYIRKKLWAEIIRTVKLVWYIID